MTDEGNKGKDIASEEIKINGNSEQLEGDNYPEEDPNEKIKALQQNLDEKNSSYDDLYERYLRIAADFDNYKKRISKEKTDLVTYGNEELIKALLNVIDNLERALEHSGIEGSSDSIIEGVDLVYRQFISCLEKFGLSRIEAEQGSKFDPNYHQAVEHIETDDITPGLIVNEMIKGYLLKERLLRPSMVAVSKGVVNKPVTDKPKTDEPDQDLDLNELRIDEDFEQGTSEMNPEENSEMEINDNQFNVEVNIDNDDKENKDDILDLVEDVEENK
jgi:molecular chaperone GrpE